MTDTVTRESAYAQAGMILMDALARRGHIDAAFLSGCHPQIQRTDQLDATLVFVQRAMAGVVATTLWVPNSVDSHDTPFPDLTRILTEAIGNSRLASEVIDALQQISTRLLLRYSYVAHAFADVVMTHDFVSYDERLAYIDEMVEFQRQQWLWTIAGRAVAAHMSRGSIELLALEPSDLNLAPLVCRYSVPTSLALARLTEQRRAAMHQLQNRPTLEAIEQEVATVLVRYVEGSVSSDHVLAACIMKRRMEDMLAAGIELRSQPEFCRQHEDKLTVLAAGDLAVRMSMGRLLTNVDTEITTFRLVSTMADELDDAYEMLCGCDVRAEELMQAHWPAVVAVSEELSQTTKTMTGEAAHRLIHAAVRYGGPAVGV